MKKLLAATTLLFAMALAGSAFAQEVAVSTAPTDGGFKPMVVGGAISMGMAHSIVDEGDPKPRFAGGGSAYFDFYLMEMLALEGNLGMVGKGCRVEVGDDDVKTKLIYMEIGLGAKLNIKGFRAALLVVPAIGLSGKYKTDNASQDVDWDRDNIRRFNLGLKVGLGYAIPVGPIAIVPGLDWSIHLLNDYDGPGDAKARAMNLMFNVGVEFGFGG